MPFEIFDHANAVEAASCGEFFRISPDAQVAVFVSCLAASMDEHCHKDDELPVGNRQRIQLAFHQQQNTPRGRFYHLSTKTIVSFYVPVLEKVYSDSDFTDTFSFQNKLFMGICRPCYDEGGGELGTFFDDWYLNNNSIIRVWRTSDGQMISSIFLERSIKETSWAGSLAKLSCDGNLVLVIIRNTIYMFDTFTGLLIRQSSGLSSIRAYQDLHQRYSLVDCALSPNGALLARLYNVFKADNQSLDELIYPEDVDELLFKEAVVEIVECNTGRKILAHTLRDTRAACCISFVPDGRGLIVQSNDMFAYQFLYSVRASAAEEKVVHPAPLPREMEDQSSKRRRKQRTGKQTEIKDFFFILPR
uniref:Uncharacterized protein n=1 Tax=Heterosigma akashiwo TaxID=2829 RepID=A0A7S4DCB0_HETAK